jgi:hypothetical protein
MACTRFVVTSMTTLFTALLRSSSGCSDGCSMSPIHRQNFSVTYDRTGCDIIEGGHLSVLKDDKGSIFMNFSWVMVKDQSPEDVQQVLVKRWRADGNGTPCIPETKVSHGCLWTVQFL